MIHLIDNFLNAITMYRVVQFGLIALALISLVFSAAGTLFYNPISLIVSLLILSVTCYISNFLFSKLLKAPTNNESYLITALILFFIYLPATTIHDALTLFLAGTIAMASKYIFAFNKRHIFNPAAFAAFILGVFGNGNALWWIGSGILLPFVIIIGLLIVRKIRRFHLFFSFLISSIVSISVFGIMSHISLQTWLLDAFVSWPLLFFATVMLTEPLTTPPTKKLQMIYGAFVGLLFGAQFQIGPIYSTPELALLIGNIYSFLVSPKEKLFLHLREKQKIAQNVYEFIFSTSQKINFHPGQYFEWTLPHKRPDLRGNRRYFTIASSPTEKDLRLGVRISSNSSSFKTKLLNLSEEDTLVASHLAGDFTLPKNPTQKLVFIAGGIGVTPFRSIIKFLIDTKEKRSITLFYINKHESDIAYKELFEKARDTFGLKIIYVLTDTEHVPTDWKGKVGRIDENMIKQEIPDYHERLFYLSGPNAMVDAYKKLLANVGVPMKRIITDYFPGF